MVLGQASEEYLAFKIVADENKMSQAAEVIKSRHPGASTSGPLFQRYHIVVLRTVNATDLWRDLSKNISVVTGGKVKFVRIPVSAQGGTIQIPTGEIIVQFRTKVPMDVATSDLHKYNLQIVKSPDETTPGRYIVVDKDGDIERALRSAKALQGCKSVRYAEPNTLQMMNEQ
jgi:hypothetical protein